MAADYSEQIVSELADHDYKFLKTLGCGQYGVVVLAIRMRDQAQLAIKITKSLDAFHAEIAIFNALSNHPSIVNYYGSWTTRNMSGVVMDYIEGRSLLDILMEAPLSEVQACSFFRQLVEAMNHSHYHCHIIHRDLKAENIMIRFDMSRLIVIDWGMGMKWNPGVTTFQNCGSPDYAAPELYRNKGYEGPEIDCWAMGVILYALVTSNFPFPGNTPYEIAYRVCKGVYPPHPGSPELVDLVSKLLCVDPIRRITLTEVLLHPWFAGSPNMLCESAGHSLGGSSLHRSDFCQDLYQSDEIKQKHATEIKRNLSAEVKVRRNSKRATKSPKRSSKSRSRQRKEKERRSSLVELPLSALRQSAPKKSTSQRKPDERRGSSIEFPASLLRQSVPKKSRRSSKKEPLSPSPLQASCSSDNEEAPSTPHKLLATFIKRRKQKSIGSRLIKKE